MSCQHTPIIWIQYMVIVHCVCMAHTHACLSATQKIVMVVFESTSADQVIIWMCRHHKMNRISHGKIGSHDILDDAAASLA